MISAVPVPERPAGTTPGAVPDPVRDAGPDAVRNPESDAVPDAVAGPDSDAAPDPVRDPWREAMRLAIAEADAAAPAGDVPVGAVVLGPDGAVIARAHNEREATGDPTAHAEVLALRRAAAATGEWRLTGCTLVVTLEPCVMCAGALVQSRVERVVFGALDEKAGATGSLWDLVRDRRLNHRPEVIQGVLGEECAAQLTAFFRTR